MYADAEARKKELMAKNKMKGFMFKIDDDPRIFPFGKFLRNTSLDEFPQFLTCCEGICPCAGTRPPTLDEYVQYEPHHKAVCHASGDYRTVAGQRAQRDHRF